VRGGYLGANDATVEDNRLKPGLAGYSSTLPVILEGYEKPQSAIETKFLKDILAIW